MNDRVTIQLRGCNAEFLEVLRVAHLGGIQNEVRGILSMRNTCASLIGADAFLKDRLCRSRGTGVVNAIMLSIDGAQ